MVWIQGPPFLLFISSILHPVISANIVIHGHLTARTSLPSFVPGCGPIANLTSPLTAFPLRAEPRPNPTHAIKVTRVQPELIQYNRRNLDGLGPSSKGIALKLVMAQKKKPTTTHVASAHKTHHTTKPLAKTSKKTTLHKTTRTKPTQILSPIVVADAPAASSPLNLSPNPSFSSPSSSPPPPPPPPSPPSSTTSSSPSPPPDRTVVPETIPTPLLPSSPLLPSTAVAPTPPFTAQAVSSPFTATPIMPTPSIIVPVLPVLPSPIPNTTSQTVPFEGVGTWFTQDGNPGACGFWHTDDFLLVALQYELYGDMDAISPYCGKTVQVTNTDSGKTLTALVADACPGCPSKYSLDLSLGSFQKLGDLDTGVLNITWVFLD